MDTKNDLVQDDKVRVMFFASTMKDSRDNLGSLDDSESEGPVL